MVSRKDDLAEQESNETTSNSPDAQVERESVQLRDPGWAALLGWLWPGAGHLYQGRYAKGMLYMICILVTFFYGLSLGGGRVVYANWKPNDYRWQYACQLGVGVPAFPAILQSVKTKGGEEPYWAMAPPFS